MFQNYEKRFSIRSYDGFNWSMASGFEEVVVDGTSKYYVVDYIKSRIVTFDQSWVFSSFCNLPHNLTHSTKYVDGSFYFASDDYFYKTNSNFSEIRNFYRMSSVYREIVFDLSSSKFYVASRNLNYIHVFDKSCSLLQTIQFDFKPSGLALKNSNLFVGNFYNYSSILVLNSVLNGSVDKTIRISDFLIGITSITIDSFGYMALSFPRNNFFQLYDWNGTDMNTEITASSAKCIVVVDSNHRLIIVSAHSIDIYY